MQIIMGAVHLQYYLRHGFTFARAQYTRDTRDIRDTLSLHACTKPPYWEKLRRLLSWSSYWPLHWQAVPESHTRRHRRYGA